MPKPLFGPGHGISSPPLRSNTTPRAQAFQSSVLQQHIDRKKASTSINRVMNRNSGQRASTSIHHPGGETTKAVTSILRPEHERRQINEEYFDQEAADERRYAYMQRKIRARKKKEAEEGNDRHKFKVGTGNSLTVSGASGLHKSLRRFLWKYRSTYKNISEKDRKYFEKFLIKHAGNKKTGSSFGYSKKRQMRLEIIDARKKGIISREDEKDFRKLINNLD